MKLPFSLDQFFEVFAQYNEGVWPMQVVLNALALVVIALLFRDRPSGNRVIAAMLSFLWAWTAIAYHFTFFTDINSAAWLFGAAFLFGALWFGWVGVIRSRLRFLLRGGIRGWIGGLLILYALVIYPLIGYLLGHRYPAVPTFGLPCPTTIFTIGVLFFAAAPLPRSVFAVPVLWSAVGSMAAFQLGVLQDLGLLAAGLCGIAAAIFAPEAADPTLRTNAESNSSQTGKKIFAQRRQARKERLNHGSEMS
jgi:hypothetical protein